MSNLTPEKAARILCALQDLSPVGFLENLYDQGIDDMREYDTFDDAINDIRRLLNDLAFQQNQPQQEV